MAIDARAVFERAPLRVGRKRHVTLDEVQSFPTVVINADRHGRSVESGVVQCGKEAVDGRRVRVRRSENMRSLSGDPTGVGDSSEQLDLATLDLVSILHLRRP